MTRSKTGRGFGEPSRKVIARRTAHLMRLRSRTIEALEQFERMAEGYCPKKSNIGDPIRWVHDATLTAEDRAWCAEQAAQCKRELRRFEQGGLR